MHSGRGISFTAPFLVTTRKERVKLCGSCGYCKVWKSCDLVVGDYSKSTVIVPGLHPYLDFVINLRRIVAAS